MLLTTDRQRGFTLGLAIGTKRDLTHKGFSQLKAVNLSASKCLFFDVICLSQVHNFDDNCQYIYRYIMEKEHGSSRYVDPRVSPYGRPNIVCSAYQGYVSFCLLHLLECSI